jgi:hypothetical protein
MNIQVALRNSAKESATILDASVLEGYNESIKPYNERMREVLGEFGQSGSFLTGSSPFMQIHLANSGLLPEGARLAERSELEEATSGSYDFLRGLHTHFGLALFTAGDSYAPNDLIAKTLAKQLRQRGIELGTGKLISFVALKLREDVDSAYGAVLDLSEQANKYNILDDFLNQFDWNHSRGAGVACAGLGGDGGWGCTHESLVDSGGYGRVVVVSGEAIAQKILGKHLDSFRRERDAEIAEIQKKYAAREATLKI